MGMNTAQINGVWTVKVTDRCASDYGGISEATPQFDGSPRPPNGYDLDGDGVMNPLTDGPFVLRLQLDILPVAAAKGIVFNPPRNTPLKVAIYGTRICDFHFPHEPQSGRRQQPR